MRKPTPFLRDRLIRLSNYSLSARRKQTQKKNKGKHNRYVTPGELIIAPTRFCLTHGLASGVVRFLKAISTRVLKYNKPVRISFRNTEAFYVPGAIYLYAELDRIIQLSSLPKPISIIDPYRRRPREVLKQIGIHQLTGDKSEVIPTRDDVIFWKATKGTDQSGKALGPILESVTERANKDHVRQIEVSGLWKGVSEAVANTVEHAYEHARADGFNGLNGTKWWMFTQIREQVFTVAVCDLGCGYRNTINQTIPESFLNKMKAIVGKNQDSAAINIAMEYGRSSTKLQQRGKGSRDALSVLSTHQSGELTFISNTGLLQYRLKNGKESKIMDDIKIDCGATVIWWVLPLKEEENASN